MTVQKLKEEITKLSTQERILFVQFVLDTIAQDTSDESDSNQLSDEWKEELEKRSQYYQEGTSKTTSWDAIKKKLTQNNR